jgi:hypothetical protein
MQYIIVWSCCIGYTSKAERLTYLIMNTCSYNVMCGLANSGLTGWPDDCACALPCGEASSNLSDGESDKGRSEAAAFRIIPSSLISEDPCNK